MGFFPAAPLVEQHWLVQNWMYGAAIAAPLCFLTALRNGGSNIGKHPARFIALSVGGFAAMLSFEECGYDFTGKHFAVKDHYNAKLTPYTNHAYNDELISLVAFVSTLQAMAAADYYLRTGNSLPAAACWAARTMHAFGSHLTFFVQDLIATGSITEAYNPGAFTSALIVPLGLWFLHKVWNHHGNKSLATALFAGPAVWSIFAYAPANIGGYVDLPKLFMWQYTVLCLIGAFVPFLLAERNLSVGRAAAAQGTKRSYSPRRSARSASPRKRRSASPKRRTSITKTKEASPERGGFRKGVKKLFTRRRGSSQNLAAANQSS